MQECILSFNNRAEVIELPVPLQEWNLNSFTNTYNFTTLVQGDIKAIGGDKLKELEINSFFPRNDYPFLIHRHYEQPETYIKMIEKWRLARKPIRCTIVNSDVNYAFSIEEFNYGKSDPTKDVHFTLVLEEYKYLNTPAAENNNKVDKDTGLKNRPKEQIQNTESYIFKSGDTLWSLAGKKYGDPKKWEIIAKANKITDPRKIANGKEIKIPAIKE